MVEQAGQLESKGRMEEANADGDAKSKGAGLLI